MMPSVILGLTRNLFLVLSAEPGPLIIKYNNYFGLVLSTERSEWRNLFETFLHFFQK